MDDYLKIVQDIISDELEIEKSKITPQAEFIGDLKLDSLDLMDMVIMMEKRFKIIVEEYEIGELTTVGKLIEFIKQKKQKLTS